MTTMKNRQPTVLNLKENEVMLLNYVDKIYFIFNSKEFDENMMIDFYKYYVHIGTDLVIIKGENANITTAYLKNQPFYDWVGPESFVKLEESFDAEVEIDLFEKIDLKFLEALIPYFEKYSFKGYPEELYWLKNNYKKIFTEITVKKLL